MRNLFALRAAASVLALGNVAFATIAASPPDVAKLSARAEKAMAKKDHVTAVSAAESAVTAVPQSVEARMLLARVYLSAGRFRSAEASFADVLRLDPARGAAALNLALARIALGEFDAAKAVIARHETLIPVSDRGLALALAGDAPGAVAVLEQHVRDGASDAKSRQNLAFAYAMSGRWAEAKMTASYDLEPKLVSQRLLGWVRLAAEANASAQVAAMLGVSPAEDSGRPAWLALTAQPEAVAVLQLAETPPLAPEPIVEPAAAGVEPAAAAVEIFPPAIRFAPRAEVVQSIALRSDPTPPVASRAAPRRVERPAFARSGAGRFVVQLGAYVNQPVAEAAWARMAARLGDSGVPSLANVRVSGSVFTRLSLTGFETRAVAVGVCEQHRARGGQCFVRENAGDAPLQWAGRKAPRFAAR